ELFLIGTEDQLSAADKFLAPDVSEAPLTHEELFNLESMVIGEDSRYARRSIRDIGLGEEFGSLIVGIERGTERILNPESAVIIEPGDLIWIFGDRNKIRELKQTSGAGTH